MSGTRKLVAILVADIVGYGGLAADEEDRTLARLRGLRSDLIDPAIAAHHGRGDGDRRSSGAGKRGISYKRSGCYRRSRFTTIGGQLSVKLPLDRAVHPAMVTKPPRGSKMATRDQMGRVSHLR